MLLKPLLLIALIAFSGPLFVSGTLWAGQPIDEVMSCPVGGEKFTVTGTAGCSITGRMMSFRPKTSCDFVTLLPVCPSNGLPLYHEFNEEQVAELTDFVESEAYESLKMLPSWQRAYAVAEHLGQAGTQVAFETLLNAFWYQPELFLKSNTAMDQLLAEADIELTRAPESQRPFLNAILAYALASADRFAESRERLTLAKAVLDTPEYLQAYISTIEACHDDMTVSKCQSSTPFNP